MKVTTVINRPKKSLLKKIWDARYLYLLLLPGVIWFYIWYYIPMDGVILAFKKYNARLGIWGSQWVGFKNFKRIFITPAAFQSIINTLEISLTRLLVEFPVPILLALMLNEVGHKQGKKLLQTVYTFPHFLSWVVISVILTNFFATSGFFNTTLQAIGLEPMRILASKELFRPLL